MQGICPASSQHPKESQLSDNAMLTCHLLMHLRIPLKPAGDKFRQGTAETFNIEAIDVGAIVKIEVSHINYFAIQHALFTASLLCYFINDNYIYLSLYKLLPVGPMFEFSLCFRWFRAPFLFLMGILFAFLCGPLEGLKQLYA